MTAFHRLHARCSCGLAAPSFALPGTTEQFERGRPFTIDHLSLDLDLLVSERSLVGAAILHVRRVSRSADTLLLDAVGFELREVAWLPEEAAGLGAGKRASTPRPADYSYDGDRLRITVPLTLTTGRLLIRYKATPRRGLYFLEPDSAVPERPRQVWSQCQDEDARHFIPCHDKPNVKMTTEVVVLVPPGMVVLSNGVLVDSQRPKPQRKDASARWSYSFRLDAPHPAYLLTLVAGDFAIVTDRPARLSNGREVPIAYYVPPARKADAMRSFGQTPRMVELFSRLTGVDYPWPCYSQVVVSDFIFGGMENTTATTMYEHILLDTRAALDIESEDLVAHELAHHWFGDLVTCRDWSHGWLNEGFATLMEHIEREDRLGRDEYELGIERDLQSYLEEAQSRYARAIVTRQYAEPIDLFDRHLYEKGCLVLHALRRRLGDEDFWAGIRLYLKRHAGGIVETRDLQRALEEVSGRSLEALFEQWVMRPGHPDLEVEVGWEEGLLTARIEQKQEGAAESPYHLELELRIGWKDGSTQVLRKEGTKAVEHLATPMARRPAWVAFDPEYRLPVPVEYTAPADLLRAQATSAPTARLRCQAIHALRKRSDVPTISQLAKVLADVEDSWMARAEAAKSLAYSRTEEGRAALLAAVTTAHPKVRRAVVAALGHFKTPAVAAALSERIKRDPSYLVVAEACRALGKTQRPEARKLLLAATARDSWADVVRIGALDGIGALGDSSLVDEVKALTRYGVAERGRRAAMRALAKLSEDTAVRRHLEGLLDDPALQVRMAVADALVEQSGAKAREALQSRLAREPEPRVVRHLRETLRELEDGQAKERRRLRDELQELKREVAELQAKLVRLEPHKPAGHGSKTMKRTTPPARKRPERGSTRRRS